MRGEINKHNKQRPDKMNDSDAFLNSFWQRLHSTPDTQSTDTYLGDFTYLSGDTVYQALEYPDGWLLYRNLPNGTEQQALPDGGFYKRRAQVMAALTWPDMVMWE